jgi:hypothetical protein
MVHCMTESKVPVCETLADFVVHDKRCVLLRGRYQRVSIRQKRLQMPTAKDRAVLQLRDGTRVFLEPSWSAEGRRADSELQQFDDRLVEVEGIANAEPAEHEEDLARITNPCISRVVQIRLISAEASE